MPALDPATGCCDLYDARPVSCRTYGPAVRLEGQDLPPCELCYVGATPDEIEAARVSVDVAALELPLLERLAPGAIDRETIVAFALTRGNCRAAAERKIDGLVRFVLSEPPGALKRRPEVRRCSTMWRIPPSEAYQMPIPKRQVLVHRRTVSWALSA